MLKQILILAVGVFVSLSAMAQPVTGSDSYFVYGKKLRDQGKYPEAIQAFKKATALNKNLDSAFIEWSVLCVKMNKPDDAFLVLKNALKLNPRMISCHVALGNLYRDIKSNYDSAIICYSAVLKIDSTSKKSLYDIAWCYNAKQEFEKAIAFGTKALELDKDYKIAYNELAHAYHASKKYDEALVLFKKYAAISISDLPLFYCGMLYLELNQYDNLQKTIDELTNRGSSQSADGLKKRWNIKKNQNPKPAE